MILVNWNDIGYLQNYIKQNIAIQEIVLVCVKLVNKKYEVTLVHFFYYPI